MENIEIVGKNLSIFNFSESSLDKTFMKDSLSWNGDIITNNSSEDFNMTDVLLIINEATFHAPNWKIVASSVLSIILPITNTLMMFTMGCLVNWRQIIKNLWPPIGILTGLCGQFVILPALAFAFTRIFQLTPYQSLGALIVCSCPGGAFSNFFVYWVDGDLELSIVMTTCSTILALLMMPINMWFYSPYIVETGAEAINVPYASILSALGMAIGPVFVGMIIRHFKSALADKLAKILKMMSYAGLVISMILMLTINLDVLLRSQALLYVMAITLPMSGFVSAYLFAFIIRQPHKICRTIGIETGCQNIPIAVGVILLSFQDLEVRAELLTIPAIYGNFLINEMLIGAYIYRTVITILAKKHEETIKDGLKYCKPDMIEEPEDGSEKLLKNCNTKIL